MPSLSIQTLTRLREQVRAELVAGGWQCVIEHAATAENDMGETVDGAVTVSAPLPCKLVSTASFASRERLRMGTGAVGQLTSWQIVLPYDAPLVTAADALRITQPTPERSFEVMQVAGPVTDEVRRIVWVEEVS